MNNNYKLKSDVFEKEKVKLTPDNGFNLVGVDYFAETGNQMYVIRHYDEYQEALTAKKERKNPDEYFILYKGSSGESLCR